MDCLSPPLPMNLLAAENERVAKDGVPLTIGEAISSMKQTLAGIWSEFVNHVPLFVAGLLLLIATVFLSKLARGIVRRVLERSRFRMSLRELLQQLTYVVVWIVGLTITAIVVFPGLTPTKALGGIGVLSLAVSFAFKDIFENFFAGVILLWRFPFEPGDFIECEGILGKVENITIRLTTIRKTTEELVIVPNSFLFRHPVDVLTNRATRRMTIVTGVAYDVDVEEAVSVIADAVKGCESVSQRHDIQVFPFEFGSSSINIEVSWWCDSPPLQQRQSRGEVVTAVKKTLDEAGLEIPFPYRTLTFKEPLKIDDRKEA